MLAKVREYWQYARNVADGTSSHSVTVFIQMFVCRYRYKFNALEYVLFRFYKRKFSAPACYMTKKELVPLQCAANYRAVDDEHIRMYVSDKLEYYLRCREHKVPTPVVLGVVGRDYDSKGRGGIPFIENEEQLLEIAKQQGPGKYLLKPTRGSHGSGIIRLTLKDEQLYLDDMSKLSFAQLAFDEGPFVVQKSLLPHPELKPIMPGITLGTARLVTIIQNNEVEVVLGCVKVPVGKNIVDNFYSGQTRNLLAGIDLSSGMLQTAYGPDERGLGLVSEVDVHPDSGAIIPGFIFPHWDEMIEIVRAGARVFSDYYTLGWDVALTEDGPVVIEANWQYDCDLLQIARDSGMRSEIRQLFDIRGKA